MTVGLAARVAVFAAGVAFVGLLPRYVSDFRASQLAYVGVYFIAILGLNILTGYTGPIALGHGAFMAIGGYTTAILVADHGVQDLWTIPLGGLIAGAAGLGFGLPALRLRGLYLALATFGIAVATPAVIRRAEGLTGGTEGINLFGVEGLTGSLTNQVDVLGRTLTFNDWLYYLCWTVALVLFVVAWLLLRGRLGRTFRAIRDSEVAAASAGINPAAYTTLAFGLSAFYAGVAGSLFAIATTFVNPGTFPIMLSVYLLVGAVVAGLGSVVGIAAGALFIQYLPDVAQEISRSPGVPSVVYGVILIAVVLVLPTGAAGLLRRLGEPLTSRLAGKS